MKMLMGNGVVGQSGGPTSAINATLCGVIDGASKSSAIKKLYGMKNGIEGFLEENLVDLSYLYGNERALSVLEATPSSALGSCRKRLPDISHDSEIYKRLFDTFKKYDIRYFFYIGGNDSMDTAYKSNQYAKICHYEINVIGIPKTIDNDLVLTDHTPGYGSASKYIATTIKEIALDTSAYRCKAVTVVEAMGRDTGWLTAAAGLPEYFGSVGADLIYLPERYFSDSQFISSINRLLLNKPSIVVAVSEGIRYPNGSYVGESAQNGVTDSFGHKYLSGTGKVLEALVRDKIGCKTRSVELNLMQRCASHIASGVDIQESRQIGSYAVQCAVSNISGKMVAFKRKQGKYQVELTIATLDKVVNQVKYVPKEYINEEGNKVTKECMEYIAPLILGERNIKYENGLPVYFKIRG